MGLVPEGAKEAYVGFLTTVFELGHSTDINDFAQLKEYYNGNQSEFTNPVVPLQTFYGIRTVVDKDNLVQLRPHPDFAAAEDSMFVQACLSSKAAPREDIAGGGPYAGAPYMVNLVSISRGEDGVWRVTASMPEDVNPSICPFTR
ncbi:hypothetical protein GCM10009785_24170 [Brooklawnia cerclae]|uniref:hypothetical protein n=1 Tax=Brooklawnia cerclae TaxID=349934 RepID=UPI00338900D9